MKSIVKRNPQAENDTVDIWFCIAVENLSRLCADRFLKGVNAILEKPAKNPGIGRLKLEYASDLYQFPL